MNTMDIKSTILHNVAAFTFPLNNEQLLKKQVLRKLPQLRKLHSVAQKGKSILVTSSYTLQSVSVQLIQDTTCKRARDSIAFCACYRSQSHSNADLIPVYFVLPCTAHNKSYMLSRWVVGILNTPQAVFHD